MPPRQDPLAVPIHGTSPWNLPNALTLVRVLLVPVFGSLLLSDAGSNVADRLTALGVFVVAMLTDRLDGQLARGRGQVTTLGKILDPIADKALLGMAFVALSMLGRVPWWITVLVLAREIGVTVVRFVVIRHGVIAAGRGGKVKTAVQALAVALLVLPAWVLPAARAWDWAAYAVLALAVALTVVTGVDYLLQAHRLRRTSPRAQAKRAARAQRRALS
jgi:CDP-diacylglycerol--glycerol-3-phosphate 3-phosphatidyltransferase